MPSSTFSSDVQQRASEVLPLAGKQPMSARAGVIAVLAGLVVMYAGLELSSTVVLALLSRTERRVNSELRAARALRQITPDGRPTILLAGNSLLLQGVQLETLRADLSSQYDVTRLGIEQTHYLDWYFGLRRLLEEGSRPSVIVLSLGTDELASTFTLGESFAHRQMAARDLPRVVQECKLDRTTASTFFFAHWSNWLGDKGFIRQCIMILLIPNFRELAGRIADHGPHIDDPSILVERAQQRLPELGEIARKYGLKLVLLVPPTLYPDCSAEIEGIGAKIGVPVWVLSPPGEFPPTFYKDGFHLNPRGAEIFTARLAGRIHTEIGGTSTTVDLGASGGREVFASAATVSFRPPARCRLEVSQRVSLLRVRPR